ncbi:MAG: signal peptidase I [Sporomusa sp.]
MNSNTTPDVVELHATQPNTGPVPMKSGGKKGKQQPLVWRELRNLFLKIAAILLFFILLFVFMFGVYRCSDNSMSLSIKTGDLVFFNRWDASYLAGDVLVLDVQGQRQVRRVVAVAGDTVDITQAGLLINGAAQYEPKVNGETLRYDNDIVFPLIVGEGQVFVLADARDNATDSRVYGLIEVEDTLGKLWGLFRTRDI